MPNSAINEAQSRPPRVVEKVKLRTLFKRRGKLIGALIWFVPVTALIVVLSLLQRDFQAQRVTHEQAGVLASAFQAEFASSGVVPTQMPVLAEADRAIADRYFFNYFYANRLGSTVRVGVCSMRVPLRLFLAPDGRFVIVFNGQTFSAEWLTETEFQAQAKSLGLPATDTP